MVYTYDMQGELTSATDQNGTTHNYSYDNLGRETADSVTAFGTNINQSVKAIDYGYNVRGELSTVASYDATSGGNVVNEDYLTYNDAGLLAPSIKTPPARSRSTATAT